MAAADATPERVASSEADFVLTRADDIQPTPPGRWARLTMTVLARYPLLHSVFWLTVVGVAASSSKANASEASAFVDEAATPTTLNQKTECNRG